MRSVWCTILLTGLITVSGKLAAQSQSSDLWLFTLSQVQGKTQITDARQLTDNADYTNQPHFSQSGDALFYTQMITDGEQSQTDVFRYDMFRHFHENLTRSATAEYSPTPRFDGTGLSVILVDEAGKQWLWALDEQGARQDRLLDVEPIGYHVWLNSHSVLAFVLGEPHTLQRLPLNSEGDTVDEHIGASLWPVPDTGLFAYTKNPAPDKQPDTLMGYDPATGISNVLTRMPVNVNYHAWTPKGEAIVVKGAAIWRWIPEEIYNTETTPAAASVSESGLPAELGWQPWLDISRYCPNGGSRLHMSNDGRYLAVVCHTDS